MKKKIFEITDSYVKQYSISEAFVGKTIVLYDDRIEHIEKHKAEFIDDTLENILNDLPIIVANPDFINIDDAKNGMQIVKKVNDNILVAVRLSDSLELKIKSLYPITKAKYDRLKTK